MEQRRRGCARSLEIKHWHTRTRTHGRGLFKRVPGNQHMIVLFILIGSLLLFRLLGLAGIPLFATRHESTVYALAVLFFFTAVAHFGPMSAEVEKMLPRWVPKPKTTVFVTGLLEIMGAIGLIIPDTRRLAGICLIVFLVAVFPANVHAAKTNVKLAGRPVTRLWLRAPMQLLFIALLVWAIVA